MGFSFWLQSNKGKKFSLDDLKKLKPEDIAKNSTFKKIINFFDLDGSGNIETKNSKGVNEWQSIFTELQSAAGDDKVLSDSELGDYLIKKSPNENIKTEEFKEFLDAAKQESIEDTYTDDKGNTITDKYGYGGILSRTIVSKDESGNEVIALVLYENNKPSQQIQKRNNEVVAIINYDYSNDEENPTTTTVFKNDRGVVEEFDIPSKKRILTQYNSNDVEHFDSNDSDRLQQVAIYGEQMYIAEYDGKGNTIIIVQNSETPELIAQKFGVKLADLIRVNKGLTRNTVLQAGQKFIVPGEFNADSKVMYPRKSEAEVKNKAIRHTFNKVYDKIFSSAIDEYTIKPENAGKDVYEYAEKYLIRKGLKKTDPNFNARKNDLANELIALNGKDAKYTAGSKIKYVKKTLNQATVNELRSVGFEPNEANQQFFARFNYLEPKQQQNVIAVLKHCKAKGITDPQKINAEIVKYYPEIQLFETDMKVLQKPTKGMARGYMARYLLQQIDAIIAMYNQVATSDQSLKTLGTGLLVEIQDLLHVSTKFINDNLGTCIAEGDSRVNLAPMLNKLRQECVNLVVLADMEEKDKDESFDKKKNIPGWEGSQFDKQFKELFNGQTLNYDAVATYLQALQEFQKAPEADRNNKNSLAYKKIEQATKALNQKIPNFESVGKRIESWSKGTSFVGGLVDLGVMVGMMYMSGGTAAIGRSAMYMGNGARLTVGNAVGRLAISDGSKFIMSEGAAILTSMVTSSAETAAFFQTTKALGALEDGQVTRQEVTEIQEGFEGLFKFSMVGSAIAGPIGNKVAELTSKALNSEPMIARIMQTAVEGNGTSLDKVLKALAENSEAISKITEFGTSFSINAGYLMYDENEQIRRYNSTVDDENLKQDETSYLGAMGNLGAMDAISKLVVAMLGGKNMAFLTPRKVQQIKASLAGYDVKLTVFKGQKIYEVTDKTGTKTRLANEQELFMFIVDREISVLKDTPSAAETISNPVTTDVTRNFEVTRNGVHTETSEVTNLIEQRLEQANDRESFVAIRDEISKLPHGEEKTRLMQAYLQKYNAWSADPSRPDIRMQYIPETETPQASVELTKETFIQHLKDIGLNEDMVNTFAENIESGSIDLSVCKDFIDVAKNDKELLSDLLGSIIFCDVKAEDIPAKIEAYKLAKSQSNLSVMDQASLILDASASKTPKQALAEVVLSNKYEDIKNSDIQSGRKKAEMIQALKDCAEKNGAQFVLDNFELLSKNYRFASEVNANNLETAKLLDEYRTKMNRPIPQERAFAILANPEHYVARIRRGIDDFEQSLERVNNNEMVSVEDFTDVLKSMLSGEESERESFAYEIIAKLPATNGQVPSKAIELVKLIKENYKDSSGDTNSSIKLILSAATSKFDKFTQTMVNKRLTNEQVSEMIEYIETLKTNNSLTPPSYNLFDAMKFAKDINGDFSAKQIFELYKKGLTITDIDKMYNESYEYGDTNYAAYNVRLELAKYADISPEVETFLKNRILNNGVRRSDSQYKYEVERLLNNFKSNDINTISLLERAFKDGYLGDNLSINRVIDFPVSDLQIAMYDLLPKPNDINLGIRLFETLKNVNQANAKIFEKVMEQARAMDDPGRIEYSVLIDVLEKIQDQNDANLIAKGIDNKLFDTTNGFEIWQMKQFVEHMENHPEVAREWVDNGINFEHISIDGFGEFINGRDSNGEKPLTEEQRKLVYEVIKYRDENGYPNMNWTSSTRTALLELSPKYYELIKNSVIGTNQDFGATAEFINKCAKNQPEVLENLEKDISNNPKLLKYFGLEAIAKHKDKVELFIEHEDLLKSFQESNNEDISGIFEQVGFDVLKEGMSILKDVPEEVKTKFKDALAKLYVVEIANKIGMVPFKSDLMLEVYKKAVNYEDDVAETLIKTLWREMGDGLKHIELSNLDFVANYIKSKDHPDRTYIIKVLNSSEDIGKNTATLTEMLENKDKLLKQVAMRCQNTNPEFVKFVEEYLNSEDAYDLVFMPNLSINTLANNFFEVSKIFQYVNTKPQDYINGHYDEKIINALKDYRKKDSERTLFNSLSEEDRATVEQINNTINQNIDNKFTQILDAISSTDIETVKLLLDKRFSIFQDKMSEINELSGAAKVILADVIRNGKRINKNGQPDKLTGQQKIDMINLIKCATSIIENFDINNYKTPLKKGAFILDSDRLHDDIFKAILSKKGLSQEEINKLKPENLNWNMKYLSLLFNTPGRDEGELADVVKAASMGDFNEFINDVNNKYGQTNLQTRQAFESNGVNYEQWLRPDVADVEFEVAGKQCHIRMWDRNPQEDMFLGSKTSCCTALDRTNGGSMAVYMLNTSYNVVELYDAKGDVVGMSRIFMAKVDGKPTLIMDNIELNHEFIKGMDHNVEVKEIRDNFFKYMNTYAEKITGDSNAQVLFYSGDIHVPNGDLTRVDNTIDFLGGIHREEVYVNAVHCSYHNPTKLKDVGNITWLKVPRE